MTGAKQTGRAVTMPAGLMTGVIASMAVTLSGAAVTAKMLDLEILDTEKIGYTVMVLLILAAWTGSAVSIRRIKRRKLLVSLLAGVCYFVVLLALTGLLFGGQYHGAGETGLLILCGCLLPMLLNFNGRSGRKVSKFKIQNR